MEESSNPEGFLEVALCGLEAKGSNSRGNSTCTGMKAGTLGRGRGSLGAQRAMGMAGADTRSQRT